MQRILVHTSMVMGWSRGVPEYGGRPAVGQLVDFQGANDEHHLNEQRGKSTNRPWPEGLA